MGGYHFEELPILIAIILYDFPHFVATQKRVVTHARILFSQYFLSVFFGTMFHRFLLLGGIIGRFCRAFHTPSN